MINENDLKKKVRETLYENIIKGYSKKLDFEFFFSKPARKKYPFQYFWDTCFHIHMLLAIDENEDARRQLETMFAAQREDGFIGNIIYWKHILPARITDFFQMKPRSIFHMGSPHMSNIIQPPMPAQVVLKIYEKTGDRELVKTFLPKLKRYYDWLAGNRDFDGDKLISIISPFESGMDFKPTFDPVLHFKGPKGNFNLMRKAVTVDFKNFVRNYDIAKISKSRYFRVKETAVNSIYAQNLDELSQLCKIAGDRDEEVARYKKLSEEVVESLLEIMYDPDDEAFYDVYGPDNRKIKILTPTIFYPLIIQKIGKGVGKKVMERHFYESKEFDVEYPVPSLAKNHPSFNPKNSIYLWRGPTWIVNNWFLHKYLIDTQHRKKAKTLLQSMIKLVEKSGFREYYNPFTGEGYGAENFTWGGLVLEMMQNESSGKPGEL